MNRSDVSVVGTRGYRIDKGRAYTLPTDARKLVVPLRTPMLPDSYTVRARVVSADSHSESQAIVFAVAGAPLSSPILAGSGGLTDTSPASVAARVAELAALGLLLGLLGFRALVWGPAVAMAGSRGLSEADRERALAHGRRCSGARSGASRSSRASPRPSSWRPRARWSSTRASSPP